MSKKNVIASKVIAKENVKGEIKEINLSRFAKDLENVNVSHIKRDRETIYIYPEDMKKEEINNEKGKKFRSSLRAKMQRFSNNCFVFSKQNDIENLKKMIIEFDDFYAKNYRITDYSLKSISSSNDASKNRDLNLLLEIIKEMKG